MALCLWGNPMKKVTSRLALATALIGSCAWLGLTPANAGTITWDFLNPGSNPGPGAVGSTETFTDSGSLGYLITADGITVTGTTNLPVKTIPSIGSTITVNGGSSVWGTQNLYVKNGSGDENGLGLTNDTAANNFEITQNSLVEIDTTKARAQGLSNFTFQMGSSTNHEGWDVYGSNDGVTLTVLLAGLQTETTDNSLDNSYKYYYFTYDGTNVDPGQGNNVLLHSFSGSCGPVGVGCEPPPPGTTPLPAALPLFASGLGALGLFGWRRKRKAHAAV